MGVLVTAARTPWPPPKPSTVGAPGAASKKTRAADSDHEDSSPPAPGHRLPDRPVPAAAPTRSPSTRAGAAAILGVMSSPLTAAEAEWPHRKPARSVRESFGAALGRGLHTGGAVVMNPRSLRTLGDIDTLLVDPRVLFTDELAVTRVLDVAATTVPARGEPQPQPWSPGPGAGAARTRLEHLTDVPGRVLVSPLRGRWPPHSSPRRGRPGCASSPLADDGLHSLRQGFDELLDATTDADPDAAGGPYEHCTTTVPRVALVCCHGSDAIALSRTTIGVLGEGSTPWGADILVDDLNAAWRVVHTIPRAREVQERAISLASGPRCSVR